MGPVTVPDHAGVFTGVSATGPDDIWAVGYAQSEPGGDFRMLVEHWDGQSWELG